MITVLAMGQSNMRGPNPGGVSSFLDSVTVWNNTGGRDDLTLLGNAFVAPNLGANPFVGGNNTMAIQFANHLARVAGDDVRLILVADGGKPITAWTTGAGVKAGMYQRTQAVLAAAGVTAVDVVIWHQGENDNPSGFGTYAARFGDLVNLLRADGFISLTTPIVIGELASQYTNMNPVLRSIAAGNARVKIARISGFPTSDNTHFLGAAASEIGMRYLTALSTIPSTPFTGILNPVSLDGIGLLVTDADGSTKRLSPRSLGDSRRKISFSASLSSAVAIPVNAFTKIIFDSETWDRGNSYDPIAAEWTPPEGVYQIAAQVQINNYSNGSFLRIAVYKNGALHRGFIKSGATASTAGDKTDTVAINTLVEANGQDVFDIRVLCQAGSPAIGATEPVGWFSGWEI